MGNTMNEERFFEPNATSLDNLEKNLDSCKRNIQLRRCEIAFLTDSILDMAKERLDIGMSGYEILLGLSDEMDYLSPSVSKEGVLEKMPDLMDKAAFASIITEKLAEIGMELSVSDFLQAEDTPETFVYVRNSLSDEAYDVFSQEFSDPKVSYRDSFREAAFAVADGKSGYCILPYEEAGGARIPGIYNLVAKLDLKITAITPVFGIAGNSEVKYALFSRDFVIPKRDSETDRYLEIKISESDKLSLSELIGAAEHFGLKVIKINTMAPFGEGEEKYYSIVLREDGDFVPFLTYVTLFASDLTPMGIYKNIE